MQLDERKLTVGATAKLTADIIAREVVVYGTVKGNLRAKDRMDASSHEEWPVQRPILAADRTLRPWRNGY